MIFVSVAFKYPLVGEFQRLKMRIFGPY